MTQQCECSQYARSERDQEQPVDGLETVEPVAEVAGHELSQRAGPGTDIGDQVVVDPQDQGDGASGDTRDDVGGSHEEPPHELEQDSHGSDASDGVGRAIGSIRNGGHRCPSAGIRDR